MRLVYIIFLWFLSMQVYLTAHDQTIPIDYHNTPMVVVIMVKNEADVIKSTLQPFVDGGVDTFFVYDTGSVDGTPAIARQFFTKCGISHAYIIEEPFIDFAASRNRALDLAEHIFPHADFMVMPDAEWYIYNVDSLILFCQNNKDNFLSNESGGCYLIRVVNQVIDFYQPRLIRCRSNVRFTGTVHELLNQKSSGMVSPDVYFLLEQNDKGKEKSMNRWKKDRDLLLQSYQDESDNPRTIFYLAQTYQFLHDWENAANYYYKRIQIDGWDEENYMAVYRLATVIDYLAREKKNNTYCWHKALHYYLKAHGMRPHRAEPLIRIAQHYIDLQQREIAFLFAQRAVALPYPTRDILFVEKYLYDFVRYDLLGQSALYAQEYEIGKNAVLKALKIQPYQTHLHHNLALYQQYITSVNS